MNALLQRFHHTVILQYLTKGAAHLCGVLAVINTEFSDEAILKEVQDRLMPRTEKLPLYSTQEFNEKVCEYFYVVVHFWCHEEYSVFFGTVV